MKATYFLMYSLLLLVLACQHKSTSNAINKDSIPVSSADSSESPASAPSGFLSDDQLADFAQYYKAQRMAAFLQRKADTSGVRISVSSYKTESGLQFILVDEKINTYQRFQFTIICSGKIGEYSGYSTIQEPAQVVYSKFPGIPIIEGLLQQGPDLNSDGLQDFICTTDYSYEITLRKTIELWLQGENRTLRITGVIASTTCEKDECQGCVGKMDSLAILPENLIRIFTKDTPPGEGCGGFPDEFYKDYNWSAETNNFTSSEKKRKGEEGNY